MTAIATFDLTLDQDVGYNETFTWFQGPSQSTVTPVNLSGCTARLMVRVNSTDALPLLSISTTATASGSVITLGGVAGTITVLITGTDMTSAGLTAGLVANYDLLITFPSQPTPVKFLSGRALVGPTYTH